MGANACEKKKITQLKKYIESEKKKKNILVEW